MQTSSRKQHHSGAPGFTLIELLVTIAVAAVLLGIAAPNFLDMSIRNRLTTYSNDIIAAVNYARSEAIRRGTPVSICRSSNGSSCSGAWNDGWIIFVNTDNDSPAVTDDPLVEPVLKIYGPMAANYMLGADVNLANDVTYGADGAANNTGVIAVCYDNETVGARAVILTRLRPRVARDTNGDRIPNRDDTANIASCAAPGA